jgi:hypothetical protein
MAAKKNSKSHGTGKSSAAGVDARVAKLVTSAQGLIAQFSALGLPTLTAEEREHASGRLRVGEDVALEAILDTMDAFPGVFQSLAAKDGGTDDSAVETGPARGALAQGQALQPLAAIAQQIAQLAGDAVLGSFSQVKDLTVPAYAIGKASASHDASVRKALAPALDFYGATARKRAIDKKVKATRAAKARKPPAGPTA